MTKENLIDSTAAYNVVRRVRQICLEAKNREAAESMLKAQGFWYEWVRDIRPYLDLP